MVWLLAVAGISIANFLSQEHSSESPLLIRAVALADPQTEVLMAAATMERACNAPELHSCRLPWMA